MVSQQVGDIILTEAFSVSTEIKKTHEGNRESFWQLSVKFPIMEECFKLGYPRSLNKSFSYL